MEVLAATSATPTAFATGWPPTSRGLCRSQRYSFVLITGIPWEDLPQSLGFGSGMTCWHRLCDWQAQGIWQRLHVALLTQLHQAGHIDCSRASLDGASIASPPGGGPGNRTEPDRQRQAGQQTTHSGRTPRHTTRSACLRHQSP